MTVLVSHIKCWMEELAPLCLAEEWDNVGLQIGAPTAPVHGVLTCLGVSHGVLDQASSVGAQLVVAHHPLIFKPLYTLRGDCPRQNLVLRMASEGIALYVSHTNLDAAPGGLGQWAAAVCGLHDGRPLVVGETGQVGKSGAGYGRVGDLDTPMEFREFVELLRERLGNCQMRLAGVPPSRVRRLAVVNGSGADYIPQAALAGADVYVTGDIKHHDAELAESLRLCVMDVGHFATESIVAQKLASHIRTKASSEGVKCDVFAARETDPLSVL